MADDAALIEIGNDGFPMRPPVRRRLGACPADGGSSGRAGTLVSV